MKLTKPRAALAALALLGLVSLPAAAQDIQERTIRFGHLNNTDHPTSMGARKFAELVAAKSGGKLQVKEFPSSQLGNEMQMQSALQGGVQEMMSPAPTSLAGIVKEFGLLDQPTQEQRAHDDLRHVAGLLPQQASDRERAVVEQELSVDHDLAEQHAGPPANSPQIEGRDPQSRRRPDRRHRGRVPQRLTDLRGAVVGSGEKQHAADVSERRPPQANRLRPAKRRLHGGQLSLRAD